MIFTIVLWINIILIRKYIVSDIQMFISNPGYSEPVPDYFRLRNTPMKCFRHTSLLDGKVNDECQYLNSVGSIEVFERVRKLAKQNGIQEHQESPNGHWTKPYASLSVQRRAEWTVTVKGNVLFNFSIGNPLPLTERKRRSKNK